MVSYNSPPLPVQWEAGGGGREWLVSRLVVPVHWENIFDLILVSPQLRHDYLAFDQPGPQTDYYPARHSRRYILSGPTLPCDHDVPGRYFVRDLWAKELTCLKFYGHTFDPLSL